MISTITLTDGDGEDVPIQFYYDITKGQAQTQDNPEYPAEIIDLWWNEDLYAEKFNKYIYNEMEYIENQIWEEVREVKTDHILNREDI